MYDLNRFIEAQKRDYQNALEEIKNGHKETHWIWYIFPQIEGLGKSTIAKYYSIKNLEEAKLYLENEYLRKNLLEITEVLLNLDINNPTDIFGTPDDLKVKSCMTLFYYAEPSLDIFKKILDKYYDGLIDAYTILLLNK